MIGPDLRPPPEGGRHLGRAQAVRPLGVGRGKIVQPDTEGAESETAERVAIGVWLPRGAVQAERNVAGPTDTGAIQHRLGASRVA
eukprot:8819848-Alexandrium_andersonii.AAC.1